MPTSLPPTMSGMMTKLRGASVSAERASMSSMTTGRRSRITQSMMPSSQCDWTRSRSQVAAVPRVARTSSRPPS